MNVLIAYGTTEGQTRKIAETAAAHLRGAGHEVALYDTADPGPPVELDGFDASVIAASVHQEQHQPVVKRFAAAHCQSLNSMPSAFLSVSLSAALEETRGEAQAYVDRFLAVTGWQPAMTLLLGGALRFTEYDFFQEQIVKFIVMKRGVVSEAESDREFTNWDALSSFLDAFLMTAEAR